MFLPFGFSAGSAQDAMPDPATIVLPALPPTSAANADLSTKFYYLIKPGASFQATLADFVDCYRFLDEGAPVTIPGFATPGKHPGEVATQRASSESYQPLALWLIGKLAMPSIDRVMSRNLANLKLRICMVPRGYVLKPTPKEFWSALHEGSEREVILKQAKLAVVTTGK